MFSFLKDTYFFFILFSPAKTGLHAYLITEGSIIYIFIYIFFTTLAADCSIMPAKFSFRGLLLAFGISEFLELVQAHVNEFKERKLSTEKVLLGRNRPEW